MRKKTILLILSFILSCVFCGCKEAANDITPETSVAESDLSIPDGAYLVRLTINPDIYFVVGENDEVIGMVAGNEDAQDVINNFESNEKTIAAILEEWTDCCNRMGFNTRKLEMAIINTGENEAAKMTQLFADLRFNNRAVGYKELSIQEEIPEFPICKHCGEILFSDSEVCPACGEITQEEVFNCFCGAKMRKDQDLCPVCHLFNLSGEYEEGWGPNGKEFIYCFCGEKIDERSGYCETCHLNNYSGEYDEGWGPKEKIRCFCGQSDIGEDGKCAVCHLNNITGMYEEGWGSKEKIRCFCGQSYIDEDGFCAVCHLNNTTGLYEEGWGPNGEEDTSLHCIECDSTNVTYGPYTCKNCGGTKISICFQCGGSGTDYVTAAGETTGGWYETCSNCKGTGTWPCQACTKHEPEYGYTCNDCGREWSVD